MLDLLGTGNNLTATATGGSYNDFSFTIDADETTTGIAISGGGGNTTTLVLGTDKATVDITAVGASNTISLTQSGAGDSTHGMNFDLDINGSSNSVTTTQSGSQYNDVDVNITGSTNTWTINQSD